VSTKPKPTSSPRRYLRRADLLTSLLLVFPLFLVYQVGVLVVPEVYNGADLITSQLLHLLHGQTGAYILVNATLALGFVVLVLVLRKKNSFDPRLFVPVVFESGIYALTMGSLIVFVMQDILHVDPRLAATAGPEAVGPLAKVVLAFGAGVHEELVFRLILMSAVLWLCERGLHFRRWLAMIFAFAISAALFSAAHHVIGGEPWRVGAFVYRFLCGLFFATLFTTRGFAVAVYTHALYDVFVLVLHP
jgi:hypothetical protein